MQAFTVGCGKAEILKLFFMLLNRTLGVSCGVLDTRAKLGCFSLQLFIGKLLIFFKVFVDFGNNGPDQFHVAVVLTTKQFS